MRVSARGRGGKRERKRLSEGVSEGGEIAGSRGREWERK